MSGTFDWGAVLAALAAIFAGSIGYLLSRKDTAQEMQIADLFVKHEADALRLQSLEVKIAENHYPKSEINSFFEHFKNYLDERFDRLEKAMKRD